MRKNTIVGITFVLVIIAAVVLYVALKSAPVKAPEISETAIVLPAGGYSEHTKYYDITADYASSTPLLQSAGALADTTARSLMLGFVRDTIQAFKTDGGFDALTPADIQVMDGRKEDLEITYAIATSARTVSYIFTIYKDTLGAHGNTTLKTFTFNTDPSTSSGQAGTSLSLANIFTSGSSYLATLSTMSRAKLPDSIGPGADTFFIRDGTTPEAKSFENFFLDNKQFVILFAPYAVAPYSSGTQTLRIPLSQLASILKPEYK